MPLLGKSPDRDAKLRGGGLLIAAIIFLSGFIAILPFDLFDNAPAYRYFNQMGEDWAWGMGAMALAAGQWGAIRDENESLLRWCGYLMALCLLAAGLCFIAANGRSVLGYVFLLMTWWEAALMYTTKANLAVSAGNVASRARAFLTRFPRRFRRRKGNGSGVAPFGAAHRGS